MVLVPIGITLFFISLMDNGLPQPVPTAVVDLDNTVLSRNVVRNLGSYESVVITDHLDSYAVAMEKIRTGEIYGFFYIPRDFSKDAIAGKKPVLSYYSNMTFFVPGTIAYKGFKTMAVSTSGAIAVEQLQSAGVSSGAAAGLLLPVSFDFHPIGNPWMSYNIYLSNSFAPCTLALMVMMITVFSICIEIKEGSSVKWLAAAGGNVYTAVAGKLLPHTVIFILVSLAIQAILFGYCGFPLNGSTGAMLFAGILLVIASQASGLIIATLIPNLRLALSCVALLGILAFSISGFSFPVEQMYGAIGIFSYILPIRYYFLIYIDQALNGIPLYYSRMYFAALLVFPAVASAIIIALKGKLAKPVYEP